VLRLPHLIRNLDFAREPSGALNRTFTKRSRSDVMNLSPEEREEVATELKRFASDLNLTDDQKEKLQVALTEAREKIAEYVQQNPNTTKADVISKVVANRDAIRQRVVSFLSPEQLKKWDAERAKAKDFLGQKIAA
jgi:transcription initiation factor TFIIIB Brf1 subunit/transcription initiation factor TFIIB